MNRLLATLLLCNTALYACSGTKTTAEIDRELRVLDSETIAAAGIDTTSLDAVEKQVLRHLLAGESIEINGNNDYSLYIPRAFKPDEAYYLATQEAIISLLCKQGYVQPSPEQFRERVSTLFGITQGDLHQHLYFNGEGWIPAEEDIYGPESEEEYYVYVKYVESLHFDPERRLVTTSSELPILVDYRNRYPRLAAVEQHINRKKRLSLMLDKAEVESDPELREPYVLNLFADLGAEWIQKVRREEIERLVARNKFLLNNDPASFQRMLRFYDPLTTQLFDKGGLRKPKIHPGSDIGELIEFHTRDSARLRGEYPGWEILSAARGDLNGDGKEDMAFVIGFGDRMLGFDYADTLNDSRYEYNDYPPERLRERTLVVALSERERPGLPIGIVNEKLIPCFPAWNSNADDAFDGIDISNGELVLHERSWMSAGSWWTDTYRYGFRFIDEQLRLVNREQTRFHRGSGEAYLTHLDLETGRYSSKSYNEFEETKSSPTYVLLFEPLPLLALEKLERGGTYPLSKPDYEGEVFNLNLLN